MKRRQIGTTLLEFAGIGCICGGVATVSRAFAVVILGFALILAGYSLSRESR